MNVCKKTPVALITNFVRVTRPSTTTTGKYVFGITCQVRDEFEEEYEIGEETYD